MMIFINAVYKETSISIEQAEGFIKLLNPICPHMTEEIWHEVFKHNDTISYETWPTYDESLLVCDTKEIAVQVNGKVRATIKVSDTDNEDIIKEKALSCDNVQKNIEGKEIVKIIVIKGRIVNIVIK